MTDRIDTLQDAVDVIDNINTDELESDDSSHIVDPRSRRTIKQGLEDLIDQLPDE